MPAPKAASHGDSFPWFKEYAASVLGDPRRLSWSLDVHGAVAVLRRWCWISPTTGVRLADLPAVLRATKKQVQRILPALLLHFVEEGGELVDHDLREQKLALEAQREQARAAAHAKHAKSDRDASAVRADCDRSATREEETRAEQTRQHQHQHQQRTPAEIVAAVAARRQA